MTAPTAPNIPLLRKAVEWAEAEAAKTDGTGLWNQAIWAMDVPCGTAYCLAGWTVYEAADRTEVPIGPTTEREARQLLRLTREEAWDLFDPDNDIHRVRELAEQIAARAGERL